MKFFKPEDFWNPHYAPANRKENDEEELTLTVNQVVRIANAKLERETREVFRHSQDTDWNQFKSREHTEKALLICIEPIETCKHEREKVTHLYITDTSNTCSMTVSNRVFQCQCGARVIPKDFEEVK